MQPSLVHQANYFSSGGDSSYVFDYSSDSVLYCLRGDKRYELSNHLGNVLAVITDRRIQACGMGEVMYPACRSVGLPAAGRYKAQVVSITDYYPFGMQIKERGWQAGVGYRYGFNGKEKDDELKGYGNSLDFGARIYDSRLGRRFNIDPRPNPSISLYACFANNPIWFADPLGDSIEIREAVGHEGSFGSMKSVLESEFKGMTFSVNDANKLEWQWDEDKVAEEAEKNGMTVEDYKNSILKSDEFKQLDLMLSNPKHLRVQVYNDHSMIEFGDFGGLQQIDMGDILQMGAIEDYQKIGSFSMLMHELSEAYYYQVVIGKPTYYPSGVYNHELYKKFYEEAHAYAEKIQAQLMGAKSFEVTSALAVPPEFKYRAISVTITYYDGSTTTLTIYTKDGEIIDKPDDL